MAEYDVITVSGHESFDVVDDFGGSMENVLIDQTASGAGATVRAESGSWTIRNVGFMGQREGADGQALRLAASGEGVVENVYLGDGCEAGTDANGVWCAGDHHSGLLTLRSVHVAQFPDNGFYVSFYCLSGFGAGGAVHIENCYSLNNNITGFRIGGTDHHVKDSVSVVTSESDVPVHANGGLNARCGRMENTGGNLYENVDFFNGAGWRAVQTKDGGSGVIRDSRIEGPIDDSEGSITLSNVSRSGADTSPPEGVPMTAKEAASGTSSGGGTDRERIAVNGSQMLAVRDAELSPESSVRTVHSGYRGVGFIDLEPPDGAYARWYLDVQTPGKYKITVRQSNGDTDREGWLTIGGTPESFTFPATGSWNTWTTVSKNIQLPSGETTLGFETTGDDVGQIDTISLDPVSDDGNGGSDNGDDDNNDDNTDDNEPKRSGAGMLLALGIAGAAVREYKRGNL